MLIVGDLLGLFSYDVEAMKLFRRDGEALSNGFGTGEPRRLQGPQGTLGLDIEANRDGEG